MRRDLRELAAAGLCQRVYGGALPVSPAVADYAGRQAVAAGQQAAGGRRARPRSSSRAARVILDGGTTALAVVARAAARPRRHRRHPQPDRRRRARRPPDVEVYLLGGRLFKHSVVTCGAAAVEAARRPSPPTCSCSASPACTPRPA